MNNPDFEDWQCDECNRPFGEFTAIHATYTLPTDSTDPDEIVIYCPACGEPHGETL